jgi:hypothetical protein
LAQFPPHLEQVYNVDVSPDLISLTVHVSETKKRNTTVSASEELSNHDASGWD